MMHRLRSRWLLLGVALLALLAGCAKDAPQDTLDPSGTYAKDIDKLQKPVFIIAIVVAAFVFLLIFLAIGRFRSREDDPSYDDLPEQMHGNTKLEIGWTILPAVVLAGLSVFSLPLIFELNEEPDEALRVDVFGQKYWWGYEYGTEGNEAYGVEAAFATANELHIPVDTEVYLTLRSNDVIHSFWAPKLNGKRDVVPGRTHFWKLRAEEPGVFSGQCAEFCGTSHAFMRLKVVAHDQASWDEWVAQMQAPVEQPTSGLAAEGFELFQQKGCAGCHQVDGQWEEVVAENPAAPNLTKLFTRDCFAGCIYDLNDRNELEAWLRDPQRKAGSLMVIGDLTEDEIDRLYAYLETLE